MPDLQAPEGKRMVKATKKKKKNYGFRLELGSCSIPK
jgi:hypothetical protein